MTKIQNQAQYLWAENRVEELLPFIYDGMPQNDPLYIEFVLLGNLVADYSHEHYPIGEPTLVDVIKLRMYEMGLTQEDLCRPTEQTVGAGSSELTPADLTALLRLFERNGIATSKIEPGRWQI